MTIYQTPVGAFTTWEDAMVACERVDMDPCICIDIKRISFTDVGTVREYGLTQKLSAAIRCF